VRFAFWPLFVGLVVCVMLVADASGRRDEIRGLLAFATIGIVMAMEQLAPRRSHGGIRGDPQLSIDVGLFVGNGLMEALFQGVLLLHALWLGSQLAAALGTSIWPVHWPWPAQALLAILAADFLEYWVHRASHRVPWLWSIHVHHHDTARLHVFKGARNHPFTVGVRIVGTYLPLVLLGAPPALLFWFQTYLVTVGSVSHANLDMRFPRFLHHMLVTPPVHRIHHARATELHDRNFAACTPLWDMLFGTWEAPKLRQNLAYGLEEGGLPVGFLRQLAWPFVWWRRAS
jgi:sterol desaturase/sphingolipid hydroxylase (fatty acid hydroxylase superfamily)